MKSNCVCLNFNWLYFFLFDNVFVFCQPFFQRQLQARADNQQTATKNKEHEPEKLAALLDSFFSWVFFKTLIFLFFYFSLEQHTSA